MEVKVPGVMEQSLLWTLIFYAAILPVCYAHLTGKVCEKLVRSNSSRTISYREPYKEIISGEYHQNHLRLTNKTENYTRFHRTITCCPDYELQDMNHCVPICSTECKNGYCAVPGECKCNVGYQPSKNISEGCIPACRESYVHGKCVGPEDFKCDEGYELRATERRCAPVCASGCKNGYCASPNVCACHEGFELDAENKCVPLCSPGCINATCEGPDVCVCKSGYQRIQGNDSACEPSCIGPCKHGKCIAPKECVCDFGYNLGTGGFNCEPLCQPACDHGRCVGPNTCACDPGYNNGTASECKPVCSISCENGSCVGPDLCACDPGYQLSVSDPYLCEPICTQDCGSGNCTAPGICTCPEGFAFENQTCVPVCKKNCKWGTCVEDDKCECHHGYKNNENGECEPVCEIPCLHGHCVSPNFCRCDYGFELFNEVECRPKCDVPCGAGKCTAVDVCTCDPGFVNPRKPGSKFGCVPHCNETCEFGSCIAPDICSCDDGYGLTNRSKYICKQLLPDGGNRTSSSCEPDCVHGECELRNCVCNKGWTGVSCHEPLFCVVEQPVNFTSIQNISGHSNLTDAKNLKNQQNEWMWPNCHNDCLDQLDSSTVNDTRNSAGTISNLILIDSPCNVPPAQSGFWKNHSSAVGGIIGVAVILLIVLTTYIVNRKRRMMNRMNEDSMPFLDADYMGIDPVHL